jgi:hypothetical protein
VVVDCVWFAGGGILANKTTAQWSLQGRTATEAIPRLINRREIPAVRPPATTDIPEACSLYFFAVYPLFFLREQEQ